MEQRVEIKGIQWQNLEKPDNGELAAFIRATELLPIDAEFIMHDHQRPEVAIRSDYILTLVHIPVFDKKLRVTSGAPLYFVVKENTIYTLQYQHIVTLQKIIQEFEKNADIHRELFSDSALSLALYLISLLNSSSFRKVTRLAKHIEIAEDAVFHGNERKMVEEVGILTRDVLDFRRIIRPQITLFSLASLDDFPDDIRAQWARISGQLNQMWELLQALHDSTKELRNTNDSMLQYKENELLRLLSFYSIIAIPILMLANPYSSGDPEARSVFWGALGILLLLLGLIFLRAKRRRVL
ncbi:MAG: CorA family divalent cation transporter [Candidatus Andersenbacteria bacterium]